MKNKKRQMITIVIMIFATIIGYLAQTVLSTGLSSIMKDSNVNAGTAQWLSTAYILVLGVMIPPTAYLTHKFSTKILLNVSIIIFTIGSLVGDFAPGFAWLVVGRVLQGAGSGVLLPVLQIAIFKVLPKEKWNIAMGVVGMAVCVAPTL